MKTDSTGSVMVAVRPDLREYIEDVLVLPYDETALFLVACKLGIHCTVSDDIFVQLATEKVIEKDYIKDKIIVKIPVFENDVGEIPTNIDSIRNIVNERVQEYRDLFKGIRVSSMGDKTRVKEYLIRWMANNPGISFDNILDVVVQYIGAADRQYIKNADNLIYSLNKFNEETSTLSSLFEEYSAGSFNKLFT